MQFLHFEGKISCITLTVNMKYCTSFLARIVPQNVPHPKKCNLVPRLLHYWDILFINLANEEAKSHSKCTVHWLLWPFLTVAWAETPNLSFLFFCLPQIESAGQLNWKWWCDSAQNNISALLAQKICVVDSLSGLGHFPYSPFIKFAFPLLLIKNTFKVLTISFHVNYLL